MNESINEMVLSALDRAGSAGLPVPAQARHLEDARRLLLKHVESRPTPKPDNRTARILNRLQMLEVEILGLADSLGENLRLRAMLLSELDHLNNNRHMGREE